MNALSPSIPPEVHLFLILNGYKKEPCKPGYVQYLRHDEAVTVSDTRISYTLFHPAEDDRASEWRDYAYVNQFVDDLTVDDWKNYLIGMRAVKRPNASAVHDVFQPVLNSIFKPAI